jgi:acyl carrier protein
VLGRGDDAPGVRDGVRAILMEQLRVDPDRVVPHARLIEDLGAAPLDVVELITALEEEFDLEIPDEDAAQMATVEDLAAYLDRRLSSVSASVYEVSDTVEGGTADAGTGVAEPAPRT